MRIEIVVVILAIINVIIAIINVAVATCNVRVAKALVEESHSSASLAEVQAKAKFYKDFLDRYMEVFR